jgi:hypothetical protein
MVCVSIKSTITRSSSRSFLIGSGLRVNRLECIQDIRVGRHYLYTNHSIRVVGSPHVPIRLNESKHVRKHWICQV